MNQTGRDGDDDIAYDTVVDSHGRITLYDGEKAVAHVTANGAIVKTASASPSWARVHSVNFIQGITLNRISVVQGLGTNQMRIIVKKISDRQREIGCDRCPKKHSSRSELCSANLKIRTFATAKNHLYDIETGEDIGQWIFNVSFRQSATVGEGTCVKA